MTYKVKFTANQNSLDLLVLPDPKDYEGYYTESVSSQEKICNFTKKIKAEEWIKACEEIGENISIIREF